MYVEVSGDRQAGLSAAVHTHQQSLRIHPGLQPGGGGTLRVVTVIEPPFVSVRLTPVGNRFYGYCIDLLDEMMKELNLSYTIYNASKYGSLLGDNWTGAVGEVVYGRADLAVSGMIITSARQDVVDFSSRYMDYSVGILIKKQYQVLLKTWTVQQAQSHQL